MRPTKFRGKRVDNEEWVYGDKIDVCNKRFIIPKPYHPTGFIGWVVGGLIEVIPETVGQYTGLKDKNGKEIYFGSRLRFSDKAEWYRNDRIKFNLRGDKKSFDEILTDHEKYPYEERIVESIEDYAWLLSSEIQEYWEVIGNTTDNPEMEFK